MDAYSGPNAATTPKRIAGRQQQLLFFLSGALSVSTSPPDGCVTGACLGSLRAIS